MNIGINLQKSRKYNLALKSLVRGLEFSYYLNDKMNEILIYDNLGMMFYERNEQQKALYYHNRAIKGSLEPFDSIKRGIGYNSAKKFIDIEGKYMTSDGFDLLKILDTLNPKLSNDSKHII